MKSRFLTRDAINKQRWKLVAGFGFRSAVTCHRFRILGRELAHGRALPRDEGGMVDPGQQVLDYVLPFPLRKHRDLLDTAAFGND